MSYIDINRLLYFSVSSECVENLRRLKEYARSMYEKAIVERNPYLKKVARTVYDYVNMILPRAEKEYRISKKIWYLFSKRMLYLKLSLESGHMAFKDFGWFRGMLLLWGLADQKKVNEALEFLDSIGDYLSVC